MKRHLIYLPAVALAVTGLAVGLWPQEVHLDRGPDRCAPSLLRLIGGAPAKDEFTQVCIERTGGPLTISLLLFVSAGVLIGLAKWWNYRSS